jgi:hypothetical protein
MTNDEADNRYDRTHRFLDEARSLLRKGDSTNAILALIRAVEQSTLGWASLDMPHPDEVRAVTGLHPKLGSGSSEPEPEPELPGMSEIIHRKLNFVSALNEYAQKRGLGLPQYLFEGGGPPFTCKCIFDNRSVAPTGQHRTKNDAKHRAAEVMYKMIRSRPLTGD